MSDREGYLKRRDQLLMQDEEIAELKTENAELRRENKYMRIFLERQAKGILCPDTATSILSALQERRNAQT